jgi:chemotaxis protein methyltransferase CheR
LTIRDQSIDRVLAAAQLRFGLGSVSSLPWIRDRVGVFLDGYVRRTGGSWEEIADLVTEDAAAMEELIGSLRVGETRFFRDPQQFEAVVRHICAAVPLGATISALSAGCSTGEEAYTLAILLSEQGRRFQVLGVDRSAEAIEKARQGRYGHDTAREVPRVLVRRHFEDDGMALTVRAPLRSHVHFEVMDLLARVPRGPFHVIFFKNVLIYLAEAVGADIATLLAAELHEEGLLVSAASEVVRLSGALERVRLPRGVIAFRACSGP